MENIGKHLNHGNFQNDLLFAERQRQYLKPYYKKISYEGRYIFINKASGILSNELQNKAVDSIIQVNDKREIYIEEKIVRWKGYKYNDFVLETESCSVDGRYKDGWMKYGQFDILLYGFTLENDNIEIYIIPFKKLKKWFWENYLKYKETTSKQINQTKCRRVPIKDIELNIGFKKRILIK